jgi:hypothetical protein
MVFGQLLNIVGHRHARNVAGESIVTAANILDRRYSLTA